MAENTLAAEPEQLKKCSLCKVEKPHRDFSRSKSHSSGRKSACKECHRKGYLAEREKRIAQVAAYRAKPENAIKGKQSCKEYYLRNRDKWVDSYRERRNTESFKSAMKRYGAAYRERFPERSKARIAVGHAVRDGRLFRPSSCSNCGKKCRPEGHHHKGYARENWLDVVWLCKPCHTQADKECP